ncbi:hypothetical protein DFQ28_003470 [Apophysomyces sp. BC1034]|nr:hypothetical protein DFQ30_003329 [Apophysomyces sp. BC1015]KAG0173988.1 hypothetical protein DFQ29_007655 [Apophysomyces sp. BC1021]KAG0189388.1 hypothetical protein DFQ28_003470 [Apophysomyces sp. BC1034]
MTTSTSIPTTSIPGGLNSSKDQLPAETSIPNVSRSPDEESLDDSEDDLQAVKPKLRLRVTNPDGDQSTDEDTGGDYTKDFLLPPSISSSTASPSLASVPVPNTYRKTQGHKTSEMSVSSSTTLNRRQSKVLEEAQSENNHSAIPTVVLDPLASPQQGQGRRNSTARMRMDGGPEKYSQQQHSGRNIPCLSSRMSDTSSVGRNAPLSPALTTTSSLQTSSNLAATMSPSNLSKYAKASYSLTNKPDNIKLYRSMAQKTNDISVQLMYAKYLLEIAGLYENTTQKKVSSVGSSIGAVIAPSSRASSNDSSQKKKRLQNEGVRWIKYLAGKNVGEAAYMQAQWMENCCYGLQKNPVKSFRLYCVAAEAGIPEAMYSIGLHYEKQGNYEKAVQSYKAAADIGLVEAIYVSMIAI